MAYHQKWPIFGMLRQLERVTASCVGSSTNRLDVWSMTFGNEDTLIVANFLFQRQESSNQVVQISQFDLEDIIPLSKEGKVLNAQCIKVDDCEPFFVIINIRPASK